MNVCKFIPMGINGKIRSDPFDCYLVTTVVSFSWQHVPNAADVVRNQKTYKKKRGTLLLLIPPTEAFAAFSYKIRNLPMPTLLTSMLSWWKPCEGCHAYSQAMDADYCLIAVWVWKLRSFKLAADKTQYTSFNMSCRPLPLTHYRGIGGRRMTLQR